MECFISKTVNTSINRVYNNHVASQSMRNITSAVGIIYFSFDIIFPISQPFPSSLHFSIFIVTLIISSLIFHFISCFSFCFSSLIYRGRLLFFFVFLYRERIFIYMSLFVNFLFSFALLFYFIFF